MSLHTSTHQFRRSAFFFWMKQNNNSAGQLITLLFSINLHYCRAQELPLCQRRDSIKKLPEQTYLPCIPKSDTFGSTKHQSGFLRWSPSPWDVSPPFLQSLLEESAPEVSSTALMNHLTYSLSRQRSCHHRMEFSTTELSFCQTFTNSI